MFLLLELSKKKSSFKAYMAIAANYFDAGQPILAKHYIKLAMEISTSKNWSVKQAVCLINLAKIDKFENHNFRALEHVYTALELSNAYSSSHKFEKLTKELESLKE